MNNKNTDINELSVLENAAFGLWKECIRNYNGSSGDDRKKWRAMAKHQAAVHELLTSTRLKQDMKKSDIENELIIVRAELEILKRDYTRFLHETGTTSYDLAIKLKDKEKDVAYLENQLRQYA